MLFDDVWSDKPDETEMAELFLREAILMKDFEHVHVLGVIGVSFDTDSSPMVILPYMANGDLRQYITSAQLVSGYTRRLDTIVLVLYMSWSFEPMHS